MITKQNTYDTLVCLILLCFGFFGSLSHLFSLALIIFTFVNYKISKQQPENGFKSKVLFFALTSCFYLFFFTTIYRTNFGEVLNSLSPMLPIPIIGILIIFHSRTDFKISSKKLSKFSQISVIFSLAIYFLILMSVNSDSIFHQKMFYASRLTLFSGNPIPFSFCLLGISIFCLADFRNSDNQAKFFSFLMFLIGAYFAGYMSGTRGTILTIIIIAPLIIFQLTNNFKTSLLIIFFLASFFLISVTIALTLGLELPYFGRISKGLDTIFLSKNSDSSILDRLEMWSAAMKAISNQPIFGYGITDRFDALKPYLNNSNLQYTHPHNDIIASMIASGITGSMFAIISIISALLAVMTAKYRSTQKLLMGLMVSISALITASTSTVFFNDISSAWLAFSAYLIWATDFKNDPLDIKI